MDIRHPARGVELSSIEISIQAILGQQPLMASLLHKPALIHHQDLISIHDGAEAVGDDD